MIRRWSRVVYPHRKAILVVWLFFVIGCIALSGVGTRGMTTKAVNIPGTEAQRVDDMLRPLGQSGTHVVGVVQASPTDAAVLEETRAAGVAIRRLPGVTQVFSYADTPTKELVGADRQSFVMVVMLDGHLSDAALDKSAVKVSDRLGAINNGRVQVTGDAMTGPVTTKLAKADSERAELIAIPIALFVLVVVLGGLLVAFLPMVGAGTAIVATMASFVLWEQFVDVSVFAQNITTLFGVGLGIDYGLLLIARYREELSVSDDRGEALAVAVAAAGRTIVFSAATVATSLAGLFFFGVPILTSFAVAGVTVSLLVAAASITVVPALLGVLGHRVKAQAPKEAGGYFTRVIGLVQRRPIIVTVVVSAALLALAIPFASLRLGVADSQILPAGSGLRQGAETLAAHYPALSSDPVQLVADAPSDSPEFERLLAKMRAVPGVRTATVAPNFVGQKTPTVVNIVTDVGPDASSSEVTVRALRSLDAPFDVSVGGLAAQLHDTKALLGQGLPYALAWLIGATLLLLFLLTGSVLIPIKAVVMNVLSLSASFGALVWVFQQGHGANLLGFTAPGYIEMFVPIECAMFAFGLSMDYEVFLLSRIHEAYVRTGDNDRAVAEGLGRAGGVITTAAILIVLVFGAAVAGQLITLKMFAAAIGIAVLIDATVIRTLLVPSTMTLLGDANWWAPRPLRWFHNKFGISESAPGLSSTEPAAQDLEPVAEEAVPVKVTG